MAGSSPSPDRWSTWSSRSTRCPRSTTPSRCEVELEGKTQTVVAEVAQQIGEGRVRCVCMRATDGLVRGTPVHNTGQGMKVPVGDAVLGHVFNVLGQPLDTDDIGEPDDYWEIHRSAPDFDQLEPRA